MIGRGCNINFIDFYGTTDPTKLFNKTTTDNVYSDLSGRSGYPLQLGILEDENAFLNGCNASGSNALEISCIEDALEADMKYISDTYANVPTSAGLYWTDQTTNVVGFFGSCKDFSPSSEVVPASVGYLNCDAQPPNGTDDWDTIWTAVQSYVTSHGYNMKFIFEYGYFNYPSASSGSYAWPKSVSEFNQGNEASQLWWCDNTGITCTGNYQTGAYLDRFYNDAKTYTTSPYSEVAVGLLYSGFDDSNAIPWGTDRVIAQQCGQVLLFTANEVNLGGYWGTTAQIPYMQIATWNDYEEATEEESGIDNCYTAVNLSYQSGSGSKMQWTLSTSPAGVGYATTNTIHHYALWTAPHGQTTLTLRKQLTAGSTLFNLSTLGLAKGNYDVYLEMVGQPSTQNEMSSPPLEYTQN